MADPSRRVQVLFSSDQIVRLQAIAQANGESLSHLIRKAVTAAYLERQPEERLEAVRRMAALSLPVSDWEQMERESMSDPQPPGVPKPTLRSVIPALRS